MLTSGYPNRTTAATLDAAMNTQRMNERSLSVAMLQLAGKAVHNTPPVTNPMYDYPSPREKTTERNSPTNKRKLLTKSEKLTVIEKATKPGVDIYDVAHEYDLSAATIRKWIKDKQIIETAVTKGGEGNQKRTFKDKTPVFTQKLLQFCKDYEAKEGYKVTASILSKHAKALAPQLLREALLQPKFLELAEVAKLMKFEGSNQWALYWLRKHKILASLPAIEISSEEESVSSDNDTGAANVPQQEKNNASAPFNEIASTKTNNMAVRNQMDSSLVSPTSQKKTTKQASSCATETLRRAFKEYKKENIYMMERTDLHYRLLPSQTYDQGNRSIARSERVSVLLATNATGEDRVVLSMTGTCKNPKSLEVHAIKSKLRYFHQKESDILPQWFQEVLVPHVRATTKDKVLLLVQPGSEARMADPTGQVKVMGVSMEEMFPKTKLGALLKSEYRHKMLNEVLEMFEDRDDLKHASADLVVKGLREGQEPNLYDAANILEQVWNECSLQEVVQSYFKKITQEEAADNFAAVSTNNKKVNNQRLMRLKEKLFRIDLPDDTSEDDSLTASVRGLIDLSWACNSKKELVDAIERWTQVEELPEVQQLMSYQDEHDDDSSLETNDNDDNNSYSSVVSNDMADLDTKELLKSVAAVEATLQKRGIIRAADLLSEARYEMFRSIKRSRKQF